MEKTDVAEKARQLIAEFENFIGREASESFKLRYTNVESEEKLTELSGVIQDLKNKHVKNEGTSERRRARKLERNTFTISEFLSEEVSDNSNELSIPSLFIQEQTDKIVVFEIWVSGDVDEDSELVLRRQILDLMSGSNLYLFGEEEPIRGSYYKKLLFLGKIISSYKLIANLKSHFGSMATRSKIDAYSELYKMLAEQDSAVLRCDNFLAIKITRNGKSDLIR